MWKPVNIFTLIMQKISDSQVVNWSELVIDLITLNPT